MDISSILSVDHIWLGQPASCAKQAFALVAAEAASERVTERTVLDALLEREKLGCTAVGEGVSIPHARLEALDSMRGFFLRLSKGIDMDAPDDLPVDLMFVLLAPSHANSDHLKALARISKILRDPNAQDMLRSTSSREDVYALLTQYDTGSLAVAR